MARTLTILVAVILACTAILAQSEQAGKTLPVPIYKPEPAYTEAARLAKINGSVTLKMTVGADGVPTDIRVIKSLDPGLDQSALDTVGQWRFRPATENGEPVAFETNIEVSFKLL